MVRRGTVTVKVRRRVEVRLRRTLTTRPVSYFPLGSGRVERVICDGCNTAIEGVVSSSDESLWCPNCEEYIAIEG